MTRADFFIIMFGVKESREPIKGEFAKKLLDEVTRMRAQKLKKDYISNEKFDKEVDKTFHNIIVDDEVRETIQDMITKDINYHRWLILTMKTPLKDMSLEDLRWASEQPYNSLTSKDIFLEEIQRRMELKNPETLKN